VAMSIFIRLLMKIDMATFLQSYILGSLVPPVMP
jgi:hypothetical protein